MLFKNRILLSGSYGYGNITPGKAYQNASYRSVGTYLKPGIYYQLSINPKNKFQAGVQYGLANFEDSGETTIESGSGLFAPYKRPFARKNLQATWWEIAVQSEGNLKGNLWMGFRAAYRSLISASKAAPPDVLIVPGYGKALGSGIPALNLYIKYKISFLKTSSKLPQ